MAPEAMRELGRKVVELLVDRSENVAKGDAWDGEFRQGLVDQLMELPPEEGRPPEEVIDQAAQEILPFALRHDHPRQFGFISSSPTWPGILADFIAAGFSINQCTWLVSSGPSQLVWRLTNTVMKMRGHFGCRQGAMICRGDRRSPPSGGHHARKSNAADGKKDPQIHKRICETPH